MKRIVNKVVKTVAPRTASNLVFISRARSRGEDIIEVMRAYQDELTELKKEMNEIRRNERRMAELYDLVFESVRKEGTEDGSDSAATA